MSGRLLRQIGTLGVWVDPSQVVAVTSYGPKVLVLFTSGKSATVTVLDDARTAGPGDVEVVVRELQGAAPR